MKPCTKTSDIYTAPVLPDFESFNLKRTEQQVLAWLEKSRGFWQEVCEGKVGHHYKDIVVAADSFDDQVSQWFGTLSHLNSVKNDEEIRATYEKLLLKISAHYTEVSQSEPLYKAYLAIKDSDEFKALTIAQKKVVDNALKDFKRSGVDLPLQHKKRLQEIEAELAQLGSDFNNHVLDATNAWHKHIENIKTLSGLPKDLIALAQKKAQEQQKSGYVLGLDMPTYIAVMTFADVRELREEFYSAYVTRASDQGPFDDKWNNDAIIVKLLNLKHEKAQILGFSHFSDYSIDEKMVESYDKAIAFIRDLVRRAKHQGEQEKNTLMDFAQGLGHEGSVKAWDMAYYSEKMKASNFGYDEEALRPYFPVDQVITGLFDLVEQLYGVRFEQDLEANVYHPEVRFYHLINAQGQRQGGIYLDLYARAHKRTGAWMDECRGRWIDPKGKLQKPVAYLVCNFMPPSDGHVAQLTHQEVLTLFHEFGHSLHHVMTQVDELSVSGISGVEWDAVELPSQLMENFCWDRKVLSQLSSHVESGEPLPDHMFQALIQTKTFQGALGLLRQLEFSLFDLLIHAKGDYHGIGEVRQVLSEVRQEVSVLEYPLFNRFENSFMHIFGGGYAAGYYSYKWAEVLSCDAFSLFEEHGVVSGEVGSRFLNKLLSQGGSQPAGDLFKAFRGREPSLGSLLKYSGIKEQAQA